MKDLVALDIEVFPNYFLLVIKRLNDGKTIIFDTTSKLASSERAKIYKILRRHTSFGFNSINYDMPLINHMLSGGNTASAYTISKNIVEKGLPFFMTYNNYEIRQRPFDHFDIKEPSPAVMISLKNYGTRIGSKKLQDLPFEPNKRVNKEQIDVLKEYCINDVDVTIDLYNAIKDRIALRVEMGKRYDMDLRSKSDAQIAEAVITSELQKAGVNINRPTYKDGYTATYIAPSYISFNRPELKKILDLVQKAKYPLAANGAVQLPKELKNYKVTIGNTTYKLGIGGLHSQEKKLVVESNDKYVMRNADFTSYYPFIIINNGLYPKHLSRRFLNVYHKIVMERLKAKREGNKLVADSLKIVINGSFGKFGSKYSALYAPDLLIRTTITGQLTLLMLIERLEDNGISVVSANTDGLEYYCPRDKVDLAEAIIFDLELISGYEMEHGEYNGLYAKDVNNYVAKYGDKVKAKGIYAETTLMKGRSTPIVYKAIREYIRADVPLERTILECDDINEFVAARTVKGGGVFNGEYLGKVVRWYYSLDGGSITYSTNGNLVPKTSEGNGVKPLMNLPDKLPDDLDYAWYINEAIAKLNDLGLRYVTTE